jgi:hypothetical protein
MSTLTGIEERLSQIETNEREIAARLEQNEQTFLDFLCGYKENQGNDLMAIADHNDRLDYYSNLARAGCVLITGPDNTFLNHNLDSIVR